MNAYGLGIQNIRCLTQKIKPHLHQKYILLLLFDIHKATFFFQLHDTKKNITLKTEQGFLNGVYTEVLIAKFVHYHHSHKNKVRFLKEKRKGERFLYFHANFSFFIFMQSFK